MNGRFDGVNLPVFEYVRFGFHCLIAIALIVLIVTLIVRALRHGKRGPGAPVEAPPTPPAADAALKILNERYARGEVDDETYRRMKDALLKP